MGAQMQGVLYDPNDLADGFHRPFRLLAIIIGIGLAAALLRPLEWRRQAQGTVE
jgi:hypothetical protein